MSEWIDVNDRIPTQNTYYNERRYPVVVVGVAGNRFVSTARLFFTSSGDDHAWFPDRISHEESVKDCVVTHWQPLPKLPGEES